MKEHRILSVGLSVLITIAANNTLAATLFLESDGRFFGPGNAIFSETGTSIKKFRDAQVRNITFIGPFTGFIPMFNNGAEAPNVTAEILQDGLIDGLTSNGILINENINTALHLDISDPATGESANIMAVAVASEETEDGSELVYPDEKGNITFNPTVYADPGQADLVRKLPAIVFTTGSARVPLSVKSQRGEFGGVDNAGPLSSGHVLIGRVGDFDHDGFLDGILVLAGNAPEDLIVGRGNPLAQIRPWHSDIPISPAEAVGLTLNNIVQNYPQPLQEVLEHGNFAAAVGYLGAIDESLASALESVRLVLLSGQLDRQSTRSLKKIRIKLRQARYTFLFTAQTIENHETRASYHQYGMNVIDKKVNIAFELTGAALQALTDIGR